MRRFLPAGGGGEPFSSSSSSGGRQHHGDRAGDRAAGLRYGGGDISLGYAHEGRRHLAGEAPERQDGSMDMLARHSSSPAGFFSNLMADNDLLARRDEKLKATS